MGSPKALSRRYPMRLLRYWFTYQLLRKEYLRRQSPLTVCEMGIGSGQTLYFLNALQQMPAAQAEPSMIGRWVGVDCCVFDDRLKQMGYDAIIEADFEKSAFDFVHDADVIILLHVLEHLARPEEVVRQIAAKMKPGSILIGGYPSVPHFCVSLREPAIRKTASAHGHVSVFSARRTRDMAKASGLHVEFLSGAFGLRSSGSPLEDSALWMRLNLLFGSLVPSWPGELYWTMRKL